MWSMKSTDAPSSVAVLQSEAFLAPPPSGPAGALLAPFRPLARAAFSAEVLDALRSKTKGVAEGSFAVLVAERVGVEGAVAAAESSGGRGAPSSSSSSAPSVAGVVELRVAADADVIRALRRAAVSSGEGGGVTVEQVAAAVAQQVLDHAGIHQHAAFDGVAAQGGACATGFHDGGDGACLPVGQCSAGYRNGGTGGCVATVGGRRPVAPRPAGRTAPRAPRPPCPAPRRGP